MVGCLLILFKLQAQNMATTLESKAVFKARARALGIDDAILDAMKNLGWNTIGSFGFACAYIPGQGDDTVFKADVLVPVLGAANHESASLLRRFYFECYSMSAAEMRSRLERTSSDPPKTMPQPEREARFREMARSLPGTDGTGVHEPAHAVVDKMIQMLEQGQLKYISWTECPSRQDEMVSVKVERFWKPDASGHMKEVVAPLAVNADVSTDLKLMQALVRRGMAFHMSHLMDFLVHEKLRKLLMTELAREPPSPEYGWLTMAQIDRADKEVFRQLGEFCRDGLAPDAFGNRPLELNLQRCLDSTQVRVMLMHLPSTGAKRPAAVLTAHAAGVAGDGQSTKAKKRARKKEAQRLKGEKPPVTTQERPVKQQKGAGKAAGKQKSSADTFVPMPAALRGMHSRTAAGDNICFGYNLPGGCTAAQPCTKGKHVCAKCLGTHPATQCTAA